jgi:small neutral amino acid transporter SnatA (MarC family)
MSGWLLLLAMVAAVNPFRSRVGLGAAAMSPAAIGVGVAVGLGGVALLATGASGILDLLQITPETFLIAGGLVAIVAGARTMFFPHPADEPMLSGWRAGLWPLAFPRILSPEVIALSLALASQRGVGDTMLAAAVGVGGLAGLAWRRTGERSSRVLAALGGVAGMLLIAVGIWMMIEGIRDV